MNNENTQNHNDTCTRVWPMISWGHAGIVNIARDSDEQSVILTLPNVL